MIYLEFGLRLGLLPLAEGGLAMRGVEDLLELLATLGKLVRRHVGAIRELI